MALASRAGVPWSGTSSAAEGRSLTNLARVVVDAILIAVAIGVLVVFAARLRRPELRRRRPEEDEGEDVERSRLARLVLRVAPYVLLALISLAVLLFAREVDSHWPQDDPSGRGADETGTPANGSSPDGAPRGADWVLAAAGGLALLALAGGAAPIVRRRQAETAEEPRAGRTLTRVLDESIDDLRAEADPRRAVIAAYARMERGLAAYGLARRPFEAPLEYLRRVLAEVSADRSRVGRLTALFELAKFSRHPLGPEAKDEAIACLVAIRSELGEAT